MTAGKMVGVMQRIDVEIQCAIDNMKSRKTGESF